MAELVTLTRPREGVAVATMTNPAIANFGSWDAIGQLADALVAAREGGARVTVLASGVPGAWFQHAWLTDLRNTFLGQPTTGDGGAWFRCLHELNQTSVVSIAAISGDTSGGGCELGWACDLRIAEEQVLFGQPEVGIGVGTGIGGTSRLRHLIGRTATAEMVLLGFPVTARRVHELEQLVKATISETGATSKKEMGAVIKAVQAKAAGRADGKTISGLVGKLLRNSSGEPELLSAATTL